MSKKELLSLLLLEFSDEKTKLSSANLFLLEQSGAREEGLAGQAVSLDLRFE